MVRAGTADVNGKASMLRVAACGGADGWPSPGVQQNTVTGTLFAARWQQAMLS